MKKFFILYSLMNCFIVYASEKPFESSSPIDIPSACPQQGNGKYIANQMNYVFKLCIASQDDLDKDKKKLLKERIHIISFSPITDEDRDAFLSQLNDIKLKIRNQKNGKLSEKRTVEHIY